MEINENLEQKNNPNQPIEKEEVLVTPISKIDFYTEMDMKYPNLTQAAVKEMKQEKYEDFREELGKYAVEMGVSEEFAIDYVDAYLGVHLSKGRNPKAEKEIISPAKVPVKPKAKSESKTTTPKQIKPKAKTKRHKCTAEELSTGQLIAKVMKFVEQNTMVWKDIFSADKWKKTREIEGIYELKGDGAGKVVVKIRDWTAKAKKDQIKWYNLCIDSYKLTKIDPPAQNTYKRIISKRQLQAAYTTKGEAKYKRCATLYSELAKCRAKGNCTTEQKERYTKQVGTCGNLGKTKVGVPTYIKYLHAETRKRRRSGESYPDALSRTAEELKKQRA